MNAYKDLPLRYVFEKNQGLSHARNRGLKEAKYPYVAFLDDDAKAGEDWIRTAIEIIRIMNVDIFGGPIYPYYEVKKTVWFKDEYEIREHGDTAKYLEKGKHLSGSNVFFRKKVFEMTGNFDPEYGMKGDKVSLGEETKIQIVADEKGLKRYYEPKLFVYHLVPKHKMRIGSIIQRIFLARISSGKYYKGNYKKILSLSFIAASQTLRGIFLVPGIFLRNKKKHPYWQNYLIEEILPDVLSIGKFAMTAKSGWDLLKRKKLNQ